MAFLQSRSNAAASLAYSTQNCTIGSLLVCAVLWNSSSATTTVADSTNGAWTAMGLPKTGVSGLSSWRLQMFNFSGNTSAAKPTVTATVTGSPTTNIAIAEYSNVSGIDGTVLYKSYTASNPVTDITGGSGDTVVAVCITGGSIQGANSPFTQRENSNFGANSFADYVNAPRSVSCSFAADSNDMILAIAGFKLRTSINKNINMNGGVNIRPHAFSPGLAR